MKNLIIYFSATGNTLYIAKNLKYNLEDSKMISITDLKSTLNTINDNVKVGFIFPTYFFSIPKFYANFIENSNLNPKCYYYGITSCNGFYGNTGYQLKKLLENKKCKLSFFENIKMPGNYLLEYNPPSTSIAIEKFKNADEKINTISDKLKNNFIENTKKHFSLISNMFSNYMYKHQKIWGYNFHLNDNCISCKACEKLCKFNNIVFKDNKPCWNNKCEHCMACINRCPKNAIEYGKKTFKKRRYKNPKIKISDLF